VTAQRRNGTKAQRRNGATAQRHNGSMFHALPAVAFFELRSFSGGDGEG